MIPDEYLSKHRKIAFILAIISIALWKITEQMPDLTEHVYSRFFYPLLASKLAWIGSIIPFALTGLIFVGIALWFLSIPFVQYRRNKELGAVGVLIHILLSVLASISFFIFIFMISFLLNHHRYTEEQLYGLGFKLTKEKYQQLVDVSVARANTLSEGLTKNEKGCTEINFSLEKYDQLIEQEQIKFLTEHNLPAVQNAKSNYFLFTYIWAGMGVGGQYQPLLGQTNITQELPDYTKPYIIGHERGHLNGFASEAGASLLGMQTLFHAKDMRLEYLGLLGLWRKSPPDTINAQVAKDIQCWNDDYKKMPRFKYKQWFTKVNDTYLKMSGHEDGVENYDRGQLLALKYYYLNFVEQAH